MRHTLAPSVLLMDARSGRWRHSSQLSSTFRWRQPLMLARLAIAALAAPRLARSALGQAPCLLDAGRLAHRPGEENIQKRVKAASIAPPKRELAEYSPVPQRGVVRRVKLPPGVNSSR